jgi:hypothetical protein
MPSQGFSGLLHQITICDWHGNLLAFNLKVKG